MTEHGKTLLQEVAEERRAEKVARRVFVVGAGSLLANRGPVAGGIVVPPEPEQGHEIDLLIFRQGIDERGDLLEDGIVFMVLKDCCLPVIRWI
jgi:hypothetical protein